MKKIFFIRLRYLIFLVLFSCTFIALFQSYTRSLKFAYIFYITDDDYCCSALHVTHQIQQLNKSKDIDILALVLSNVSVEYQQALQTMGVKVRLVDPVFHTVEGADRYAPVLTKFKIFDHYGYDRLVYLDVDTYIVKNMDHLFQLPKAPLYVGRAFWTQDHYLTTLIMVLEPSRHLMNTLIADAQKNHYWDMDAVDRLLKGKVPTLAFNYSILTDIFLVPKDEKNMLGLTPKETYDAAYAVHFSAAPWLPQANRKPFYYSKTQFSELKEIQKNNNFDPILYKLFDDFLNFEEVYCPKRNVKPWPFEWGRLPSEK